jgi:hypothetical protein
MNLAPSKQETIMEGQRIKHKNTYQMYKTNMLPPLKGFDRNLCYFFDRLLTTDIFFIFT